MLTHVLGFHLFWCCLNTALEDNKSPFCFPCNKEEKKTCLLKRCNYLQHHISRSIIKCTSKNSIISTNFKLKNTIFFWLENRDFIKKPGPTKLVYRRYPMRERKANITN